MKKFTKEEKELLESNPNIKKVLLNQVLYSKEFKEKAIKEYNEGKTANQIFEEAGIDISILSIQHDYACKIISKWRKVNIKDIKDIKDNKDNIDMHISKKKYKEKKSEYQKLLERNEYLEAENEFLKKLSALCDRFRD